MIENDSLCISCYDNLKSAYNFKKKCVQSDILRKSQVIKIEKELSESECEPPSPSPIKDELEIEIIEEFLEEDPIKANESSDFECSECNEILKDEISLTKHLDEMHCDTLELIETFDDVEIDDDGLLIKQESSSPNKKRKRGRASKYPEDGS